MMNDGSPPLPVMTVLLLRRVQPGRQAVRLLPGRRLRRCRRTRHRGRGLGRRRPPARARGRHRGEREESGQHECTRPHTRSGPTHGPDPTALRSNRQRRGRRSDPSAEGSGRGARARLATRPGTPPTPSVVPESSGNDRGIRSVTFPCCRQPLATTDGASRPGCIPYSAVAIRRRASRGCRAGRAGGADDGGVRRSPSAKPTPGMTVVGLEGSARTGQTPRPHAYPGVPSSQP